MNKTPVVLASASPRRAELLKLLFKSFKVCPSRVDEARISAKTPKKFAIKAALAKATDVSIKHKNALVIGADTIVVLGKKILGKPKSKKDAVIMLKSLAGKVQRVITGIAVINSKAKKIAVGFEETRVKMKKVKEKDILDYVRTGSPMDKAGAYGIQEIDEVFIDHIKGDFDNVVGLPVEKLKRLIQKVK